MPGSDAKTTSSRGLQPNVKTVAKPPQIPGKNTLRNADCGMRDVDHGCFAECGMRKKLAE